MYVTELDLLVTVMLLEGTLAVLSPGTLCEDHGKNYHFGPVVRNHISSKMAGRSIAIRRTTCRSLSLVYRQALPAHLHLLLLHFHRKETGTLPEQPASTRSESMSEEVRGNSWHGPAETENPYKNEDNVEV